MDPSPRSRMAGGSCTGLSLFFFLLCKYSKCNKFINFTFLHGMRYLEHFIEQKISITDLWHGVYDMIFAKSSQMMHTVLIVSIIKEKIMFETHTDTHDMVCDTSAIRTWSTPHVRKFFIMSDTLAVGTCQHLMLGNILFSLAVMPTPQGVLHHHVHSCHIIFLYSSILTNYTSAIFSTWITYLTFTNILLEWTSFS